MSHRALPPKRCDARLPVAAQNNNKLFLQDSVGFSSIMGLVLFQGGRLPQWHPCCYARIATAPKSPHRSVCSGWLLGDTLGCQLPGPSTQDTRVPHVAHRLAVWMHSVTRWLSGGFLRLSTDRHQTIWNQHSQLGWTGDVSTGALRTKLTTQGRIGSCISRVPLTRCADMAVHWRHSE